MYISRMLAPMELEGDGEDSVCGSGVCVTAPHWIKGSKDVLEEEEKGETRYASPRGGRVEFTWKVKEDKVILRGHCCMLTAGVCER